MCEPDCPIESGRDGALSDQLGSVDCRDNSAGRTPETGSVRCTASPAALIGKETADKLQYPSISSFGAVWWFRIQQRYGDIIGKLLPARRQDSDYSKFTSLLQVSTYDKEGISYRLPDHIYAEESSKW